MRKYAGGCAKILVAIAAISAIAILLQQWINREPPPAPVKLAPSTLKPVATVSDRFLSYNVEMVELTGGRFWRPYSEGKRKGDDRYQLRPPIDLSQPRLVKLAAALGPAYVRFSGTWANATYFDPDNARQGKAPQGFDTVLSGDQWRRAVEFARATDAKIVTSFATSPGTRDEKGEWQSDQAERLMSFTKGLGGEIAAAEFANEPETVELTQAPKGYTPEDYRRDYGRFHAWMRKSSPSTRILAPGVAELGRTTQFLRKWASGMEVFDRKSLISSGRDRPDAVSFHYYGGGSERCGKLPVIGFGRDDALSAQWLALIDQPIATMAELRNKVAPGAPLWITETGETACGGNPWAATFLDTFRFTDQIARAARQGVEVYMHNTLSASDYALLDEHSFAPRPNYWAAWLWRNFMGSQVLDAGDGTTGLNIYSHCLRGKAGGVALLAINLDERATRTVVLSAEGESYTLEQGRTEAETKLNGVTLTLGADNALPTLVGKPFKQGALELAPRTISFLTFPQIGNPACQAAPLARGDKSVR